MKLLLVLSALCGACAYDNGAPHSRLPALGWSSWVSLGPGAEHPIFDYCDEENVKHAMDAFHEVGPGKHFLGSAHTLSNFESAFYRSTIADNNSFEQWSAEGSLDAAQRANGVWKQMLADYEPPALDPAIDEALLDFMAREKASFADRDY